MPVTRYKKKPDEVWALQFTGRNLEECEAFAGGFIRNAPGRGWVLLRVRDGQAVCPEYTLTEGWWILKNEIGALQTVAPSWFDLAYEQIPIEQQ